MPPSWRGGGGEPCPVPENPGSRPISRRGIAARGKEISGKGPPPFDPSRLRGKRPSSGFRSFGGSDPIPSRAPKSIQKAPGRTRLAPNPPRFSPRGDVSRKTARLPVLLLCRRWSYEPGATGPCQPAPCRRSRRRIPSASRHRFEVDRSGFPAGITTDSARSGDPVRGDAEGPVADGNSSAASADFVAAAGRGDRAAAAEC